MVQAFKNVILSRVSFCMSKVTITAMVLLLHILFITGLLVSRHQHKVHLLSTLVEADFTAMQQLIVNWNTPHAVRKIQGMCYSWLLI